jgi:hypothetical protein
MTCCAKERHAKHRDSMFPQAVQTQFNSIAKALQPPNTLRANSCMILKHVWSTKLAHPGPRWCCYCTDCWSMLSVNAHVLYTWGWMMVVPAWQG